MSRINMDKLKEKDSVRLTDEARAAIRRTEEFTQKYGRKPSSRETERIERAAGMETRILYRYRRINGHLPEEKDAERIRRAASEAAKWADAYGKRAPGHVPAGKAVPDARQQRRASAEFAAGSLLVARDCSFSLDDYKTKLNNNVLVVGGSGTGKTRTIVTPNLMQAVGSYCISDPKGNLHKKYSAYLKKKGYRVQVADFTHPERSMRYNPMAQVKSTQDIQKLATILINSKEGAGKVDPYWDRTASMLLSAIMGYMLETEYSPCDFRGILELLGQAGREDDEDRNSSELAKRFALLRSQNPDSWACAQFDSVNTAPDKTFDCTRACVSSKFSQMDSEELRQMMSGNDCDFAALGQEKTVLFVIVSDTDRTMDDLVNLFFTQAMQALCRYADDECEDSRLPVPVRFILDDFATNCRIDEFPRMISSIRSRGISVMLMIQSEAQLAQGYGYDWATIVSNCDTYVYLSGNDVRTAQAVSERWNKPLAKVLYMPVGHCLVFRRGSQPVYTVLNDPVFAEKVNTTEKTGVEEIQH